MNYQSLNVDSKRISDLIEFNKHKDLVIEIFWKID
jgi:hypothetical protein